MTLIAISNLPLDSGFRAGFGPDFETKDRTIVVAPESIGGWLRKTELIDYEAAGGSLTNAALAYAGLGGSATIAGPVSMDLYGVRIRPSLDLPRVELAVITPAPAVQSHSLAFIDASGEPRFLATFPSLNPESSIPGLDWRGPGWITASAYELTDPVMRRLVIEGFSAAANGGRRLAFDLADPNFVDRHRESVLSILDLGVDVLLTGPEALDTLGDPPSRARTTVITRGAEGVEVRSEEDHFSAAAPKGPVIDTTGAGDALLGALLYGLTRGLSIRPAIALGLSAAREIVGVRGTRAASDRWTAIAREAGL